VHQVFPVVFRTDDYARWQPLLNFRYLFRNALRDGVTILAHQHHGHAEHCLLSAVCRSADAKGMTNLNFREIFHPQRHDTGGKFYR
jgi:hypothetical protein